MKTRNVLHLARSGSILSDGIFSLFFVRLENKGYTAGLVHEEIDTWHGAQRKAQSVSSRRRTFFIERAVERLELRRL